MTFSPTGPLGGGLIVKRRPPRLLRAPLNFEMPPSGIGNWEYLTPPENQGQNPWCAAYAMCMVLSASHWRQRNFRVDFDEGRLYRAAKKIDGNNNPGTQLESVIDAAKVIDMSVGGKAGIPKISEECLTEPEDIPFMIHKYGILLCGFTIDDGWPKARSSDGLIPDGTNVLGGHAVVLDSFRPDARMNWGTNSWGLSYGLRGRFGLTWDQCSEQFIYGFGMRIEWP
jgi:hypothetical protein